MSSAYWLILSSCLLTWIPLIVGSFFIEKKNCLKQAPKKLRWPQRHSIPRPVRRRCHGLPAELWSQSAGSRSIAHFRVAACLSFKASPGAQPFKWKRVAYSYANQTHFPYNSWAPRLTSKPRLTATRKWPICWAHLFPWKDSKKEVYAIWSAGYRRKRVMILTLQNNLSNWPCSYSQYWTGTSLQWRLMQGNLFKCKYSLIYSPALASIAS